MADDLSVVDVAAKSRYELRLGDRLIGEAVYRRPQDDDRIAITHVEIEPALQGRGYGGRLVDEVLRDVDRQRLGVIPVCPFVAYYIDEHPEHQHLRASDQPY